MHESQSSMEDAKVSAPAPPEEYNFKNLHRINPHRQRHAVRARRHHGVFDGPRLKNHEAPARRRHVERLLPGNPAPERASVAIYRPVVVQVQDRRQRAPAVVTQPEPFQKSQLLQTERAPVEVAVVALFLWCVARQLALARDPVGRRGLSGNQPVTRVLLSGLHAIQHKGAVKFDFRRG